MNSYKKLTTSRKIDLYEGDNLADKIRYLFPQKYNGIDLSEYIVRFNYIDLYGEERSYILEKDKDLYKERLSYHFPVDNKLTEFFGKIVYYISFSSKDNIKNVLFHTENHMIEILSRQDSIPPNEILPNNSAGKILKEVYELEDRIDELEKNSGIVEVNDVVKFVEQTLTEEQQAQVRENIDALPSLDNAYVGHTIIVKEVDENGKPVVLETKEIQFDDSLYKELEEQIDQIEEQMKDTVTMEKFEELIKQHAVSEVIEF